MGSLTIGKVAGRTGVSVDTIRFYEREGLIPEPVRLPSGYRDYAPAVVRRLRFIKRAKELGFSLREITGLLSLRVEQGRTCGDVRRRALEKIEEIREKRRQLGKMERALQRLADDCTGKGPTGECPILDALGRTGGGKTS